MRSEHSEAFRRYLQNQPKAIAYAEQLPAANQQDDQWMILVAGLTAVIALTVTLLV
ncbi:MAG: hypothetical protein O3A14_00440 [Cyanobacteria bacterium]|nr:hypothetical protein [Cyanobacteriota bacterium]